MSCRWWTVFIASLVVGVTDVSSETTAYPEIPKHLLECYMNDGIYHRSNRMPNSYESFVDLISKIENGPSGRNINARELSLVLMYYLKLDGIQSMQSHTKMSANMIPFAPSGDEYFKHRLTLIGLIPKIDQTYLTSINESLSKKELCNLHFMLSYSVDPYKRDNERCSPLYEEVRSFEYGEPMSDWNPFQSLPGYHPYQVRNKRHERSQHYAKKSGNKYLSREEVKKQEKNFKGSDQMLNSRRRRRSGSFDDKKADVEVISVGHHDFRNKHKVTEMDKFTIGNQELLGENAYHPKGHQSLVRDRPGRYGGRRYLNTGYSDEGSVYSGIQPGMPLSDCPSVNGIITTPYGSLAVGHVIAGLAAGLNPEEIPPTKLSVNPAEIENRMDMVSNIWGTTLAGNVADTISSSGLVEMENLQILKGGWNESASPRWYLLKNNQHKHLTEVSLRGSLDGLFLGLSAKEITNKHSNIKLSQMLQLYYEYFWGEVGAKNRVMMRPQYAPDEIFRKQVYLMSLVLKRQKTNVITVLNYDLIASDVVRRVSSFIHNMDDKHVNGRLLEDKVDLVVNVVAVVDATWSHESLLKIFETLRSSKVVATPDQANLTILCGSDGRTLMSVDNSADMNTYFTPEMLMQNCSRGMNYPLVFDALEHFYTKLYREEEISNKMNTAAQVALLFPYDTFVADRQEYTIEKSRDFQHAFPDVRLVIAANGRPDGFNHLVKDPKNLFSIAPPTADPNLKTIKNVADGIIRGSYQSLNRPSCGPFFDDDRQGPEIRVTKDVFPEYRVYYRLQPNYFFRSYEPVIISVRSKHRAPITVCHSREIERPYDDKMRRSDGPSQSFPRSDFKRLSGYNSGRQTDDIDVPVQCKTITSDAYKIELEQPCYGAYTLKECRPLYISLQPPEQSISIACPSCRQPFNVQYDISTVGLTCYNSAVSLLNNPIAVCLSLVVFVLFNRSV